MILCTANDFVPGLVSAFFMFLNTYTKGFSCSIGGDIGLPPLLLTLLLPRHDTDCTPLLSIRLRIAHFLLEKDFTALSDDA